MNTNHYRLKAQPGYILLSVVFTLTILATLSFLLSQQSAVDTGMANKEQQRQAAQYAAEAGLNHAIWQYNQDECTGYTDLNNVTLGSNSYSVTVTPTSGSPISIIATGIHANGAKHSILREQVKVHQNPSTLALKPDAVNGKDAYLWYPGTSDNYGSGRETWVSTMSNDKTVALYQFDLGTVPTGSKVKILSASLSLHHWEGWDSNVPISAHRITHSWNETEVSWDNRTSTLAWDTPAGDFDPEIIDTTLVGPTSNIRYEWQLKSVVEKWLNGSQPNYGVLLRTTAPNIEGERFYSSDDNDSDKHPSLTITYACECGQTCVVGSSCSGTYADNFTTAAWNNNDGDSNWAGDWIELDSSGAGTGYGKAMIIGGELRLKGTPSSSTDPSVAREVDLSASQSASLSFDFRTGAGVEAAEDSAVVEISGDGGSTWMILEDFVNVGGSASDSRSYDISAYLAVNTRIRFRIKAAYGGPNEYFYVDNLAITASCI